MKKIVSLTILNNEADIIESFVRYNMTYVDKMVILDNGCTDNTIKILRLLQAEGYDIEIIDVSLIDFEQFRIMNKYLRVVNEKFAPDWIIPLDADEFLMTNEKSVRAVLEKLPLTKVYRVTWRTFVMSDKDTDSGFVCRDMQQSYIHKDGKVIIPAKLIKEHHIILSVGQHNVVGDDGLQTEVETELYMAHYPNRSLEQVKEKSLCHSIRYVNYLNRRTNEGLHRNIFAEQAAEHINDHDDSWFEKILRRRMEEFGNSAIEHHPINLESVGLQDVIMKYGDLAKPNVFLSLYNLAKVMSIKAYNSKIEKYFVAAPTILVYGTGNETQHLFDDFPQNRINIRAYINSSPERELTMFQGRLVITPRLVKFFRYDKIILASRKYQREMRQNLIDEGIDERKIDGAEYILSESIKQLDNE